MSESHFARGTKFIYAGGTYWSLDTVTLPSGGFVIVGTDRDLSNEDTLENFDPEFDGLDIFNPDMCKPAPYEPRIGDKGKLAINGKTWRVDDIYSDPDDTKWVVLRCVYTPRGGIRDHTVKLFDGFKFAVAYGNND